MVPLTPVVDFSGYYLDGVTLALFGRKGEATGDAHAGLGIIRRKGLGKLRHLDTNWLWVDGCAAQGRLEYSKAGGAEHVAFLFATALDNVTIMKHMAALDNEMVENVSEGGVQERLQTVRGGVLCNTLVRSLLNIDIERCIRGLQMETERYGPWTGVDLQRKTYRTTTRSGPAWGPVAARIISCAGTGRLLNVEDTNSITRSLEHGPVEGGPSLCERHWYSKEQKKKLIRRPRRRRPTSEATMLPVHAPSKLATAHQHTAHHTTPHACNTCMRACVLHVFGV